MNAASLPVRIQDRNCDLLNGGSVAGLFRSLMPSICAGGAADDVRVERCWPVGAPVASGFALEWTFAARGRRHAVYGEWGAMRKHRRSRASDPTASTEPTLTADGLRGLEMRVPGADLVLRSPDRDAFLPQMSVCLDRHRMSDRLVAFGLRPRAGAGERHSLRCRLGGYRPGRRATVRFGNGEATGQNVHLCGKTFRDDRGRRLIQLHLRVSEELRRRCGGRVRVPAPVGFDDELNMALFVWMPGARAETVGHATDAVSRAAVEALVIVHELPHGDFDAFGPRDEYAVVDRWRRVIGRLIPPVAGEADDLAARLEAASARTSDKEPAAIHRDFYEKQLILSPRCVTVLDLDTMARGDVCVDIGNYLAHLLLRELASRGDACAFPALAEGFVSEYEGQRGRLNRHHLAFYMASSLFRLGAVHALRSRTSGYRPLLWRMARHLLDHETFESRRMPDLTPGCGLAGGVTK
ncbi:MAG: hypothetical protein HOP29_06070 [Phycisphaerales bacterium]|nr:hypothetical protein [Phycisphaerales bacterium]